MQLRQALQLLPLQALPLQLLPLVLQALQLAQLALPPLLQWEARVEVFPNANNSRVALDVRSANQSISYRTEFSMGVANVPRVGGQFFWRDNDTVPIFGIRVALLRIAEIGNGWSLTNSKNVIDFPNTTNLWSPITVTDVPNDKNVAFKKLSSTFSKAVNGSNTNVSVTLDSYFASEIVTINGTIFVPNAIKYSLTIENFPFKFGNTTLAIAKGIIQKTGLGIQYDATARNVTLGNGRGGFNWVKNATYDNTITNVTADNALSNTFTLPIPKVNETEDDGDLENGETLNVVVFRTPIGSFTKFVWDPQVVLYEDQLLPNFPLNSTGNTTNQKNAATSASVTSMGVSMLALVAAWFIHFM
ncbi:hypothetical protein BKA69DRAFT_811583 [Paraphysoderma sedebokerense]|nr:hypothetical protein BKA69DRAFT_811583 [Paraphysoderma sedebokerense]